MFKATTTDAGQVTEFLMNAHQLFTAGKAKDRLRIFNVNGNRFKPFIFKLFLLSSIEWKNSAGIFLYKPATKTLHFQGRSQRALTAENAIFKPDSSKWEVTE